VQSGGRRVDGADVFLAPLGQLRACGRACRVTVVRHGRDVSQPAHILQSGQGALLGRLYD